MTKRSMLNESRQVERAVKLIELGARLQVLEGETELSYERLLKLYKEVAGKSPPKGQLPFSTDWFLTWQPNIHASLFMNIFNYLQKTSIAQERLALDAGVDRTVVSKIERAVTNPSIEVLLKLANQLDVDLTDLFVN